MAVRFRPFYTIRTLGHHANAKSDDVVDTGAFTGDGCAYGRVEPVVGDRERGSGLFGGSRSDRVLPCKRLHVLFGGARATPGRVRTQDVQMNESSAWYRVLRVAAQLLRPAHATSGS